MEFYPHKRNFLIKRRHSAGTWQQWLLICACTNIRNMGQYSYLMKTRTSTGTRGNRGLGTNLAGCSQLATNRLDAGVQNGKGGRGNGEGGEQWTAAPTKSFSPPPTVHELRRPLLSGGGRAGNSEFLLNFGGVRIALVWLGAARLNSWDHISRNLVLWSP